MGFLIWLTPHFITWRGWGLHLHDQLESVVKFLCSHTQLCGFLLKCFDFVSKKKLLWPHLYTADNTHFFLRGVTHDGLLWSSCQHCDLEHLFVPLKPSQTFCVCVYLYISGLKTPECSTNDLLMGNILGHIGWIV